MNRRREKIVSNNISSKSVQWRRVFPCGQTDRQTDCRTDGHDKANREKKVIAMPIVVVVIARISRKTRRGRCTEQNQTLREDTEVEIEVKVILEEITRVQKWRKNV
jgi:hypothetical protein